MLYTITNDNFYTNIGIVWKHKDPHIFFSSSKDCTVYQHMFKDAKRPGDEANPVGIDISVTGEVASAMSDKLSKPSGIILFGFYQFIWPCSIFTG